MSVPPRDLQYSVGTPALLVGFPSGLVAAQTTAHGEVANLSQWHDMIAVDYQGTEGTSGGGVFTFDGIIGINTAVQGTHGNVGRCIPIQSVTATWIAVWGVQREAALAAVGGSSAGASGGSAAAQRFDQFYPQTIFSR